MFSLIRSITAPVTRIFNVVDIYTSIGEKYATMHATLADIDIELQTSERQAELEAKLAQFRTKQKAKPTAIAA